MDLLTLRFYIFSLPYTDLWKGYSNQHSAVRAKVFVPEIRNAANALTQMSNQGIRYCSKALGGLIVSVASAGIGFGLDAATYLLSFYVYYFLKLSLKK